jgi:cell division protein FtsI/penicillin-binding protein 2
MKKEDRNGTKRLSFYSIAAFLFLLLLIGRLMQIQLIDREKYTDMADIQYKCEVKLLPERGMILDRNYRPLAMNIPTVSVMGYPGQIRDPEGVSLKLARALGKSQSYFLSKLKTDGDFAWLLRREPYEVANKIELLNIDGIECQTLMDRRYPKGHTASQLLGFTNVDGKGLSGIELAFDAILRGVPGKAVYQRTGTSRLLIRSEYPVTPPEDGQDIVLTIDYLYQTIAERELRRAILESDADSGVVVIMDPRNAQVLAMASQPDFDPNNAGEFHPSAWRSRAITDLFEPGSTFKTAVLSAVLDEHLRNVDDRVFCENGKYKIKGELIHDSEPHGWLTVGEAFVQSSNIGLAKTAMGIDRKLIYKYARNFGFGMSTGIELKGEIAGILKPTNEWSGFTPVAMAYGHEVGVTPLQMCNMFCVIANGGFLLRPTILKEIRQGIEITAKGEQVKVVRRVISQTTADTMKSLMNQAVEHGTGKNAYMAGVEVCGKTGTAHMVSKKGRGYLPNEYIASFGGFFPKDKPRIAMFVMIDNPKGGRYYGGDIAAPCFKRIAEQIIAYEGAGKYISTDPPAETMTEEQVVRMPNLVGYKKSAASRIADRFGLEVETLGKGEVITSQTPAAGKPVEKDAGVTLSTQANARATEEVKIVPAVTGLPVRNALNLLTAAGINAVVDGTGRVVQQKPGPGHRLKLNEQVLLHCESSIDLRKLLVL